MLIYGFTPVSYTHLVISIINEIFEDGEYDFKLLFENLWWSGLRLTNKEEIEYLLNGVKYKNVGFILDTGHMINNNRDIKNSKEGIKYIKKNIENIGAVSYTHL